MAMFMRVTGLMIKPMVMVFIFIWMVLNTLEIGMKINNMVMVSKFGQMVQDMKENMN